VQTPSGIQTPKELKSFDGVVIAVHPRDAHESHHLSYAVGRFTPAYSSEYKGGYYNDGVGTWVPGEFIPCGALDDNAHFWFYAVSIVPIKMIRFTEQFGDEDRLVATRYNHNRYIFLNALTNFRDALNAIVGDETPMPDVFQTSCPKLYEIWELMNATE
jgi:hypothetical protein